MDSPLSIDEVSRRTGLTAHTLRYYERIGLIAPVTRAAGGQRRYAAADLDWIAFLLRLRETRMPVARMQEFATLRSQGDAARRVGAEGFGHGRSVRNPGSGREGHTWASARSGQGHSPAQQPAHV